MDINKWTFYEKIAHNWDGLTYPYMKSLMTDKRVECSNK